MNTKTEICVVTAIISGNILNCPYAFANNTEFFANQQTTTRNTPTKKNDSVQEKNLPWLAKINYFCRFRSRITLQQMDSNPYSKNYAKVPTVTLKIKDGLILFPYFFQELSLNIPNRKKMTSQSDNFSDKKIQSLLRKSNLGNITSWKTEWRNGNLRFLVNYNGENFQISPLSRPDLTLDEWTKKKAWSTSIYKKAVLGTLAVGAAAAAGYGIYKLVTTPQPVGLTNPNRIPDPSETDLQKGQQANIISTDLQKGQQADITPSNIKPSGYFDINTFRAHRPFEVQYPHIIFAGAPNLIYRHYVPMMRTFNFSQDNKNHFGTILNLEYDLSVAENQCDWNAKEIIAKTLLTIAEKYGTFPQAEYPEMQAMADARNIAKNMAANPKTQAMANVQNMAANPEMQAMADAQNMAKNMAANPKTQAMANVQNMAANPEMQAMADAQNMAILHAAIALKQVLAQRKTTVICKNNSNLSQNDIYKTYLYNSIEQDLALDRPLEQYLKTANSGEFLMGSSILPIGSKSQFNDIMELAKIIDNPGFLNTLISPLNYLQTHKKTTQQNKDLYRNAVVFFVDRNFNFTGKEFLRKITMDYFMKIYDKAGHFANKLSSSRLKLRDCNGIDIYGNVNVCTYCAAFELIRRNPENKDFIAFGGMFDLPTINKILTEALGGGYKPSLSIPYRRFNWNGQKVYDTKEEEEKLNKRIDDIIEKHSQRPAGPSYYKCQRNGKFFYMTDEEFDEFGKMVLPPSPLDLFRTNDLSSRTRAQASYLVLVNSMNDWVQRSPFLQPNAKGKFLTPVDKDVYPMLRHVCGLSTQHDSTLPTLMSGELCDPKDKQNKLNFMFGALGISFANFGDISQWLKKRFLNETTVRPPELESAWVDLQLICAHIINPFSPIVGTAGFNIHARLILQEN